MPYLCGNAAIMASYYFILIYGEILHVEILYGKKAVLVMNIMYKQLDMLVFTNIFCYISVDVL